MTTQTLTQLRDLKLSGMANALEQQLQQTSTFDALPFTERLSLLHDCLLYTSPSPRDKRQSRMPSSA